jgi:glycosyltransferase involved in cell wall biosynthesis
MFSVITITYNREALLKKAVHSVLKQSYREFVYYVVDDGSTDNTAAMIGGIDDNRLVYIRKEHTGRLSVLRNIGLDRAQEGLVAFLDSDDQWEPGYLQKLAELFNSQAVSSVVSNAYVWERNQPRLLFNREVLLSAKNNPLETHLSSDTFVIYPSCFSFKKSDVALRFNEQMKHGDGDLFVRILSLGNTAISEDPLVNILKHDSNMSSAATENPSCVVAYAEAMASLDQIQKSGHISAWLHRKTKSRYLYKYAYELVLIGRTGEARKNYFKAAVCFPLNVKAAIRYVLALLK